MVIPYMIVKRIEDEKQITLYVGENKQNGVVISKNSGYCSFHGILSPDETMEMLAHTANIVKGIKDKEMIASMDDAIKQMKDMLGGENGN